MNYIKEINAFYNELEKTPLTSSAIALWYALLHMCNKFGWSKEFSVAVGTLSLKSGLSERSVSNARNELKTKGYIDFKSRGGSRAAIYQMNSLSANIADNVSDSLSGNRSGFVSDSLSDCASDNLSALSNKQKEKHKQEREIACEQLIKAYEEAFGALRGDPSQLVALLEYADKGMEMALIINAIRTAKAYGADVPVKYADSILSKQLQKGILTVASQEPVSGGWTYERGNDKGTRTAPGSDSDRTHSLTKGQVGRIRKSQLQEVP